MKAVGDCLGAKRGEGEEDLLVAAVTTLGSLEAEGGKRLVTALKRPTVKDRPTVLRAAIDALASQANPKQVKLLCGYLDDRDPETAATTATALAAYTDAPEKLRRQIVEKLLKAYGTAKAATHARQTQFGATGPKDSRRYRAFLPVMSQTLTALTYVPARSFVGDGQRDLPNGHAPMAAGYEHWKRWFDDHKRKSWPKRDDSGDG